MVTLLCQYKFNTICVAIPKGYGLSTNLLLSTLKNHIDLLGLCIYHRPNTYHINSQENIFQHHIVPRYVISCLPLVDAFCF